MDDCTNTAHCRGWCRKHYSRWSRHGSPDVVLVIHGDLRRRIEALIDRDGPGGCWLWLGSCNEKGYARVRVDAERPWVSAHAVVYELLVGPIPEGLELDHVRALGCLHRHCVNPAHMEPVTHAENIRRSWASRR